MYISSSYNYIGAFLTFRCNMGCSYCLNRQGEFLGRSELSGDAWIKSLSTIKTREDFPITFQGGEPTLHKDFYKIANELHKKGKKLDLLTNGDFDLDEFCSNISKEVFKRKAPYASIRFSFHKNTKEVRFLSKVYDLKDRGYSVGIWGLSHPDMVDRNKWVKNMCRGLGVDYREKEYLDDNHGTYKYSKYMVGGVKECLCKPSELLIAPDGLVYRCHRDLYSGKGHYERLSSNTKVMVTFEKCYNPKCNPCDIKIKTDRNQAYGHTSVEIKEETNG